ncbi:hypothetical protein [Streptomyces sp. WMMC905]|uniref:hypothetical protein n=1 Tax=Streptomyces sp. WMMC905 TaxID=3404123 RepID=UPI003B96304E
MSWPYVDYDSDLWMKIPTAWEGTPWKGSKQWAQYMAEAWWGDSDFRPSRKDLKGLVATLRECAERLPATHPGFDVYLHLPDPRFMPLPVYVAAIEADGDRDRTLKGWVSGHDADLVEQPVVEDFGTEMLGSGLKSLRYTRLGDGREIVAGVRYAWRSEECRCDIVVVVSAPDPRRVVGAMDDLDAFVGRITLTPPRADLDPSSETPG